MGDPVSLTLLAIGTAATGYAQVQAGKAQSYEYKRQARQAQLEARDKEIERKGRLLRALATRNVQSAASGTALEGTAQSLVMADSRQANLEALSSEANTASTVAGLRAGATNAKRLGAINAAGTVISGAGSIYGSARGPKPKEK